MNKSREIKLANSDKTATVDSCCWPYLSQFEWHELADGRAARLQQCDEHPDKPHLILMENEVADRHRCDIENISGMWDDEDDETCYECPAEIGEPHSAGCPIAICLVTGGQRIECNAEHDCGSDAWSGLMPGEAECIEYGFMCKWVDDAGQVIDPSDWNTVKGHWVRTTADDPDGGPDFERLETEAIWDRDRRHFVIRRPNE